MSMSWEQLKEEIKRRTDAGEGVDALSNDCENIEFLLDRCEIDFPEGSRFFGKIDCEGVIHAAIRKRLRFFAPLIKQDGVGEGEQALAYTGDCDFSHTCAEWESVLSLGIFGLRARIADYAQRAEQGGRPTSFYTKVLKCYDAALRFMERAGQKAIAAGKREMGEGILHLCQGAPRNLFEALQTSIIYYTLQMFFDATYLRTMGRLDTLYRPYFAKEERDVGEALLLDYLREIDKLGAPANIPFALSGTDEEGNDLTNELSYLFLDLYGRAGTTNTKMHILCSKRTPDALLDKAFRAIRDGHNSIVFLSDERVIEALEKQGREHGDATQYHVVGCYECGARGELTCSCNARVNIPKALELALNGGRDMLSGALIGLEATHPIDSYEALEREFERQLAHLCEQAMILTDLWESHYREIHSSPFLSGSYLSALERGGDLYCEYTAKYNSSSVNALGLATAADSLLAIKKMVYEEKLLTLGELVEILKNDWADKEYLRLYAKNKCPKYGQGDASADGVAKAIVDQLIRCVCRRPNVKGGGWRLGLFSIDWRWSFGEKTAASADGRRKGESLSQNTGACFGADKNGATAHLISAARLDTSNTPNGAIVDLDLHSSSVRGENGIKALVSSLRAYFALGGFAVHYNVLDTEVLLDAKRNPEKYPTLQVRLCGWNVLFSSLSEKEKDEFIARSMK